MLREYALLEDSNEPGAQQYRFKVELIHPNKGSAVGYIAKYISKNIDGFGLDSNLETKLQSALELGPLLGEYDNSNK